MTRIATAAALIACCLRFTTPAAAVDGAVQITEAKALAGHVTTGDDPGFPVTITVPGSYVLASNLEVPASRTGIVVKATEVSIDLNGFRINGRRGTAGSGIDGRQRSLTVRNGTVRNFKDDGIKSIGALLLVDNMRIEENGHFGVFDAGSGYARIVNSTIFGNSSVGILCKDSCHVENNIVSANNGGGVEIAAGGTVLGNTIYKNGDVGLNANGTSYSGYGNNTIVDNDNGVQQILGLLIELFPNACNPQAC